MEIIYFITVILVSLKTVCSQGCDACLDGVCYENTELQETIHPFLAAGIAVDRVENIVYYVPALPYLIKALNLTDKTVTNVLEMDESTTILGLTVDQATRDLYFSTNGSDVYKYNPVSNVTVSIIKPIDDARRATGKIWFKELIFSGKLYALTDSVGNPRLYEYDPETGAKPVDALKDVDVDSPIVVDKRGDIYYWSHYQCYKLPKDSHTPVAFRRLPATDFTYFTDKDGVIYFRHLISSITYRLNYNTNFRRVEVGAIPAYYVHFDKYNNMILFDGYMYYLTANTYHCKVNH